MATRPAGVTLVAVIVWITGLLQIIGAIFGLIAVGSLAEGVRGLAAASLIVTLIIGVITIAAGVGLLRGSNVARVLVTIFLVLSIASAIYSLVSGGSSIALPIVTAVLALLGIILLFTGRASAFFRSR